MIEQKWRPNLFELAKKPSLFTSGHRLCSGCVAGTIVRMVMMALPNPKRTIIANATGCLEVASTIFPYTAWKLPWIHNAFENAAATASGIEAAFKALKRKGLWKKDIPDIIAFGGDGGTYDIGLQALSGAIERGHDFTWILYDNEAYMNTGIQRSGSTPFAAATTTSPAGKVIPGKMEWKKPIGFIIAAHMNAYVATANPFYWQDLMKKVRKAVLYKGPSFLHVISTCDRGWRFDPSQSMIISKLATDTCLHPLWEFDPETRTYSLTDRSLYIAKHPDQKLPVERYLETQGRFRHLFKPERRDDLIKEIQERVDKEWEYLLKLTGFS